MEAVLDVEPVEQAGEVSGDERVAGADDVDDGHLAGGCADGAAGRADARAVAAAGDHHLAASLGEQRGDGVLLGQGGALGHQVQFVGGGDQHVGEPGQGQQGAPRLGRGPQAGTVVDVEADGDAEFPGSGGCRVDGLGGAGAQRGCDPGQMEDPDAGVQGGQDVLGQKRRSGRAGAVVGDADQAGDPVLAGQQARRAAVGVDLRVGDVDLLRAQRAQHECAELVVADASHPAGAVPESGQTDRDVGLRAGDGQPHRRAEPDRAGGAQGGHGLPDGDDVGR